MVTDCPKEQLFRLKQACLVLTKRFQETPKACHIKNAESWARALCVKAVREVLPDYSSFPFSHLPKKDQKLVNHKRWQLDQVMPPSPQHPE